MKAGPPPAVVDPNSAEAAECSLVVRCFPWETFDGDRILGTMVMMYQRKAHFSLICKALDDLREHDEALLYVGARTTCERWAPEFVAIGLQAEIDTI